MSLQYIKVSHKKKYCGIKVLDIILFITLSQEINMLFYNSILAVNYRKQYRITSFKEYYI